MNGNTKCVVAVAVALGLGLGVGLTINSGPAALAQGERGAAATAGPRYTVLETDGTNLLVTDNQTNTFYFYTIEKDAEIGSDLKLRGSLDLNGVGQPTLRPKRAGGTTDGKE